MFSNMRYCPETVLIQSAFLLAEKLTNLDTARHSDVAPAVKVVVNSICEVSKGLCIHGEEELLLIPIEKKALHCKLHFWLYKTWCQRYDSRDVDEDSDLDGFPALPMVGTRMFVSVLQELQWESLLLECLLHSSLKTLPMKLKDILGAITEQPSPADFNLFTLLFDSLIGLEHPCITPPVPSIAEMLINALDSLCEIINNEISQVMLLKKLIEHVFEISFGIKLMFTQTKMGQKQYSKQPIHKEFDSFITTSQSLNNTPIPAMDIEKLTFLELQKLQESLESSLCLRSPQTTSKEYSFEAPENYKKTTLIEENISKVCSSLEVLKKLFTKYWTDVCHWRKAPGLEIGCMDLLMWHPLHHWILALHATLGFITQEHANDTLQLFCSELAKYIEAYATKSERQWVSRLLQGELPGWSSHSGQEEGFHITGSQQSFIFTSESLEDSLETALWRINQNLAGSEECFNWLLTTEELFDDPRWLQCIEKNATLLAGKEQLVMMADILSMQRQILEYQPGPGNVFLGIKEVIIDVFKDLPSMDQDDILRHIFSMSLLSGLDVRENSVLFDPSHTEEDKRALLEQLQIVLKKLVDNSSLGRATLSEIKEIALKSPYIVLSKALNEAMAFGHSNAVIYKILQEIPVLCNLTTSESRPKLLCEILSSLSTSLKSKQEEKNLLKLVQLLLKPYKLKNLPGFNQPLLNLTEFIQSCILPKMKLNSRENTVSFKLAIKLLKASLTALDTKTQVAKGFTLKYLLPITWTLLKQLDACKVSWLDMSPRLSLALSLAEVAELRGLILDVIKVCVGIFLSCFQENVAEIAGPLVWLSQKVKELDWMTGLHIKPLQDMIPDQHSVVPTCVMQVCGLKKDKWKQYDTPDCDVVHCLFGCSAVSDLVLSEVVDNLNRDALTRTADNFNYQVVKALCQVMSYFTKPEMSRVMLLFKELSKLGALDSEEFVDHPVSIKPSAYDIPNINFACIVSNLLRQVFQRVSEACYLPWDSQMTLSTMVKHYVNTIKSACQELVIQSDKSLTDDVVAHVFVDICHVISLVPNDVTDPLFILALDVASSVEKRHASVLKDCVAMVPISVYTESLMQKLGT